MKQFKELGQPSIIFSQKEFAKKGGGNFQRPKSKSSFGNTSTASSNIISSSGANGNLGLTSPPTSSIMSTIPQSNPGFSINGQFMEPNFSFSPTKNVTGGVSTSTPLISQPVTQPQGSILSNTNYGSSTATVKEPYLFPNPQPKPTPQIPNFAENVVKEVKTSQPPLMDFTKTPASTNTTTPPPVPTTPKPPTTTTTTPTTTASATPKVKKPMGWKGKAGLGALAVGGGLLMGHMMKPDTSWRDKN